MRLLPLPFALLAVLAVLALAFGQSSEAAFPGKNGKIAFVKSVGGNDEVFVMNPDGTGQENLSNHLSADTQPAWRADGNELLLTSVRTGKERIWKVLASGGTAEPVALLPGDAQESRHRRGGRTRASHGRPRCTGATRSTRRGRTGSRSG